MILKERIGSPLRCYLLDVLHKCDRIMCTLAEHPIVALAERLPLCIYHLPHALIENSEALFGNLKYLHHSREDAVKSS